MIASGLTPYHWIHRPSDLLQSCFSLGSAPLMFRKECPDRWKNIIELCCKIDPSDRPTTKQLLFFLTKETSIHEATDRIWTLLSTQETTVSDTPLLPVYSGIEKDLEGVFSCVFILFCKIYLRDG